MMLRYQHIIEILWGTYNLGLFYSQEAKCGCLYILQVMNAIKVSQHGRLVHSYCKWIVYCLQMQVSLLPESRLLLACDDHAQIDYYIITVFNVDVIVLSNSQITRIHFV